MLEVGLGGRLDAVNVLDADCAVLTSVDIDHVDYLGRGPRVDRPREGGHLPRRPPGGDRRAGSAAVGPAARRATSCSLARTSALRAAREPMGLLGPARASAAGSRTRRCAEACSCATPPPRCARSTRSSMPVAMQDVRRGLAEVALPGRFQVLPGRPQVILDVAHNVEAARNPRRRTRRHRASRARPSRCAACCATRTSPACCARSRRASRAGISPRLPGPRGASAEELEKRI